MLWDLRPSLDRQWHQCCAFLGLKTRFRVIKQRTDLQADEWESAVSSLIAFFFFLVTPSRFTNAALNCISEPCKGLKGDCCTSAARSKSWGFMMWRAEIHQMQRCKDLAFKCIYSYKILGIPANLSQALREHKKAESYSTAHAVEPCLDTSIIVGTVSEPASKLESEHHSGKRRWRKTRR